ncbi:MAG: hypothetical protein ACD_10C00393G0002 [uncultured bacterium]|nr:MAG: hypothetical protein ACD_10C00393G0002 [uncultured bacterium]
MHVGHHRGHPAHVVILAQRPGFSLLHFADIALDRSFPKTLIGHVDGKFLRLRRDLHAFPRQHELALFAVQCKDADAVANCQYEQSGGAINRVAGGNLCRARLQKSGFGRCRRAQIGAFRAFQDRENGPDRNIDINIRRAVERIEQQQVFTLRVTVRDGVRQVHFLGSHRRQMAAPFVRFKQNFVGENVEFFLRLTLHIVAAGFAKDIAQAALADGDGNGLTGPRNDFNQKF